MAAFLPTPRHSRFRGNDKRGSFLGFFLLLVALAIASPAFAASPPPTPELIALVKQAVAESTSFEDRFAAQVWLMDMSARLKPRIPDPARRLKFLRLLHAEATRADVPPELVLAVIEVESDFRRFAISRVGARGFMQVMPFWLEEIGKPEANLFEPQTNLRIGCTILHYYLQKAGGDLRRALAAYNGSGNSYTYSDKVLWALSHQWYRE